MPKARHLAPLLAALALAACGAQHTNTKPKPTVPAARFCSGLTDRCLTVKASVRLSLSATAAKGRISDVSSFQGHPDWRAAKAAGIAGAIVKAGEYTADPDAAWNISQLRVLHLWYAIYWFVRDTGCSHEAGQIIAAARALHSRLVVNDLEVPEAAGYGACLVPAERRAGLVPVDYTAPGTWPGGPGFGETALWQAEYGPTLHPFWHPVVAWQCSDGVFGCVTFIPGIGDDDVSINMGITRLGAPPIIHPHSHSWAENFTGGFLRGFQVGWDRRHHRKVPRRTFAATNGPAYNTGFQDGYRAGART